MKKYLAFLMIPLLIIMFSGCEKDEDSTVVNGQGNTLNDSGVGNGDEGSIVDYFYDFEDEVDVKFYRYSPYHFQGGVFDPGKDTLNFKSYPGYFLAITPDHQGESYEDTNGNGQWDPGEPFIEAGNRVWDPGELFTDLNENGLWDVGEPYDDINGNGEWDGLEPLQDLDGDCEWDDADPFTDLNTDGLWTPPEPIDEWLINGVIDSAEVFTDSNDNNIYDSEEDYTDVNLDGEYSFAEEFTDEEPFNGVWDPAEPFVDRNDNEVYDLGEPFTDANLNCNWDDGEQYIDMNGNGIYDDGIDFLLDTNGNGEWDGPEDFTDENGNDEWDGDSFTDLDGDCIWDDEESYVDDYFPYDEYNPDEPFTDANGNSFWDDAEPFEDINGDGIWNDTETYEDVNGDGEWTPGEPYIDANENGYWNDVELFEDHNGNGVWDIGEIFEDMNGDCIWDAGETFFDQPLPEEHAEWNGYTDRQLIVYDQKSRVDSIRLVSQMFTNIDSANWQLNEAPASQRYVIRASPPQYADTTMINVSTFDSLIYITTIEDEVDEGIVFADPDAWEENRYEFVSEDPIEFSYEFIFSDRRILKIDSLMYRQNTDCNDNGILDTAEEIVPEGTDGALFDDYVMEWFIDEGNGKWDDEEAYYDGDGNGEKGPAEPFEDRNCNGVWDQAEEIIIEGTEGAIFDNDISEWFIDIGNGKWDKAEEYVDSEESGTIGIADPGEFYQTDIIPNNFLIDYNNYPDLTNYRCIINIYPGETLTDRNGITYTDIIEQIEWTDEQSGQIFILDSLVTVYSNTIVESFDEVDEGSDYYIAKTQWQGVDMSSGHIVRENDYHLYKLDGYLYKYTYPSYFMPYGYWGMTNLQQPPLEDGFWFENFALDEVLYYSPGGLLRDGERVYQDTTIVTRVATYQIDKSFSVDSDEVFLSILDTTFTDCFKITRELTMVMYGTGVEYGERVITWLAKDVGVVKDQLFIRWTESPDLLEEDWYEYSRLELAEFRNSELQRSLFSIDHRLHLDDFEETGEFNNDPFQKRRTAGLQRVTLPNNNQNY